MTGTTSEVLLERANRRLRGAQKMSRMQLSYILRGSRRCSAEKAWAFHQETGVPMEELMRWPKSGPLPTSTDTPNPQSSAGGSNAGN